MTAIDYDFEFLEDGKTIYPISVGMIGANNREYYAVNGDIGRLLRGRRVRRRIRRSPWLMEHVVPSLPRAEGRKQAGWLFNPYDPAVKPLSQIADEVAGFILEAPDPELWASYGAYDHVCLAQLWGSMDDLPAGVPMYTNDLQQEIRRLGVNRDDLPRPSFTEHHALNDARYNRVVRKWLAARS